MNRTGKVMKTEELLKDFYGDIEETDLEYFSFLMQVAEKVEDLRKRKGLSQHEAGRKAGTSQVMASKYESGDCNPSIGELWAYARALGANLKIELSLEF